jgi:hypothetical protein
MNPTITITVSPRGEAVVEATGYAGSTCQDATRSLVSAVGLVLRNQPTAERFLPASVQQSQQIRS